MRPKADLVKWAIWGLLVLGVVRTLFFVPNGPQYVVNGLRFGGILMLGAIGLSLTYKILNFANFSHGDLLIFGAYVALTVDWMLFQLLPKWLPALASQEEFVRWLAISFALLTGIIAAMAMAYSIDRLIYRRMRRSAAVVLIIASFGMALFLRSLVQALWGTANRTYALIVRPPTFFAFGDLNRDGKFDFVIGSRQNVVNFAGTTDFSGFTAITMTNVQLVTLVVAFVLVILLHFFLKYTKTGKAMRAMSDNMDLARVSGINTERMIAWTWAIGAGMAVVAGVFIGMNFGGFNPNTGSLVLLSLFAAVILGGIGSPYGAMLGGLMIGLAQNILVAPAIPSIPTAYQPAMAFILMILMLLVRPQGLLGEAERRS